MRNLKKYLTLLLTLFLSLTLVACSKQEETPAEDEGTGEEEVTRAWGYYTPTQTYSSKWNLADNRGVLNTEIISGTPSKKTAVKGGGNDTVTILVYMCGTDLESRSSMGSYDLQEMAKATISDKVNLLVYTGGCSKWHISGISNSVNQIYRVVGGGQIERLVENAGSGAMVDPNTLVSFLEWGVENYPADRYDLIFWDHGSGTMSGYGYDEKYSNAGSMDLAEIDQALTAVDVSFDFIGFDACLMATTETALMLAEHADYMIASEESEPGYGWYYTDWLTKLSANTSMSTLEIGKNIVDGFVDSCAKDTPNQSATLSLIDLAELAYNVPDKLSAFALSAQNLINNAQYKTVSTARSNTREFASDSRIDMIDLVDLAGRIDTTEATALKDALLSAIKYNRTSNDMSNSYGLSIYFPYRTVKYTNTVLNIYDKIDMNEDYAACIRSFVSYQTSGQVSSGGSQTAYSSLSQNSYSQSSYASQSSSDDILNLLGMFLGSSSSSSSSSSSNVNPQSSSYNPYAELLNFGLNMLFSNARIHMPDIAEYIEENHFDVDLNWKNNRITISEEQWGLVDNLVLNVFVDDGEGYIDLGSDNIYEIDDDGNLLAEGGDTWLAMSTDGGNYYAVMPYYFVSSTGDEDSYVIYGNAPCLLNGERANLSICFTSDNPNGFVAGASYASEEYADGMTAKALSKLEDGDEIQFICDYYTYDGEYENTHVLKDKLTVREGVDILIGDVDISDYTVQATYKITDIYQQNYWTAPFH